MKRLAWVVALALTASGTAHAAPAFHWCPGQPWDASWGTIYDWNWNTCHDWQRGPGLGVSMGNGPWGLPPATAPPQPVPPPWAPGAQVIWNLTAQSWGFWNNAVWTPV